MPGSTHVPGVNHDVWKVLLETTIGRRFVPFRFPLAADECCRLYELQPDRGHHWLAVGGCVVGPDGEVTGAWGRIDPDGEPLWGGFEALDDETVCANGCRIPRGRLSSTSTGRRLCLPCTYESDAEERPHKIHQAPWLPPGAEPKQKVTKSGEGEDKSKRKLGPKPTERWRLR